ncbi:MAG: dephospho-CoA kinase [Gammaproteobacteria bacterium]|nr:dephospho-CoA kinase [Gammaproteobacteria bacterium]
MLVIGLTGGIGSGKSTAAEIFSDLGVPVLDTDQVAREVVLPATPALDDIIQHFGDDIILDTGELDRAALRQIIFENDDARVALEKIVHPRIRQQVDQWIQNQSSSYCIIIVPLLIEKGWDKRVDRILVVDVPSETQIDRARQRDNQDSEQVKKIIATQISRSERLNHADDIITNDGGMENLQQQVHKLHKLYKDMANTKQAQ